MQDSLTPCACSLPTPAWYTHTHTHTHTRRHTHTHTRTHIHTHTRIHTHTHTYAHTHTHTHTHTQTHTGLFPGCAFSSFYRSVASTLSNARASELMVDFYSSGNKMFILSVCSPQILEVLQMLLQLKQHAQA
jgi:hypothetical protein